MGPSGSGKTTLLDVLAGRKTAGKATGSVLFAGVPPTVTFLRRYTGYVEQFGKLPARIYFSTMCNTVPCQACAPGSMDLVYGLGLVPASHLIVGTCINP